MRKSILFLLVCFVLSGAGLVGCSNSQTPQASAADAKSFKGGPMPESARKAIAEAQQKGMAKGQEAQSKHP